MTYRGGLSRSSCQNAAIMARVHATASRRALVTSVSYERDRSRITLDEASYSEKTFISSTRNARRFFGESVAKCAFISAPTIVSSTDGGGMSSRVDGGKPAYSGMVPPDFAPQGGREIIERRNNHSRNRGNESVFRVNHRRPSPASGALARPRAVSHRPVPVGAGRVAQVRNLPVVAVISAFQRGSI